MSEAFDGLEKDMEAMRNPEYSKDARIAELTAALKPFANATVTPDGQIIGLMREDIARARAALAAVGEK